MLMKRTKILISIYNEQRASNSPLSSKTTQLHKPESVPHGFYNKKKSGLFFFLFLFCFSVSKTDCLPML